MVEILIKKWTNKSGVRTMAIQQVVESCKEEGNNKSYLGTVEVQGETEAWVDEFDVGIVAGESVAHHLSVSPGGLSLFTEALNLVLFMIN